MPSNGGIGASMDISFKYTLGVLVLLAGSAVLPANAQEVRLDAAKVSQAILVETNVYRTSKGLTALKIDEALQTAAHGYASFLAQSEGFGHTADGQNPAKRVTAQGYKFCYVAENMWGGWKRPNPMTAEEAATRAMEAWKKSPGHNANLLDKRGRQIGIGSAAWQQGDRVVFRIVQVFGDVCHAKPEVAHLDKKRTPLKKGANKDATNGWVPVEGRTKAN